MGGLRAFDAAHGVRARPRCHTSIGFKDPHSYDGELLFPERFPREVVDRDKAAMGSYAVAGEFQQRPTMREGGLFKRGWFRTVKAIPAGVRWVRYGDLAATADGALDMDAVERLAALPDIKHNRIGNNECACDGSATEH